MKHTYLIHHGIGGQKWGVRNGPPYPLGSSDHSASERKAGKSGWSKEVKQESKANKESFHLSDKQKKAIKIGVIATTAALATVGGVYLYKTGTLQNVGLKTANTLIGVGNSNISKVVESTFGKPKSPVDISESYKNINPHLRQDTKLSNVNFDMKSSIDGAPLHMVNCQSCSFTHEMKRRGFDGFAQNIDTRQYNALDALSKLYKNPKIKTFENFDKWSNFENCFKNMKNGERGDLLINLSNGGGHSLRYEIVNNRPIIMDGQIEKAFEANNEKVWKYIYNASNTPPKFCRTDNLELNDVNFIKKFFTGNI